MRETARGLDLNRDFVKLEAVESQGLASLLTAWDPHVVIDLHTTNGSYHGYHLTYASTLAVNADPRLVQATRALLTSGAAGAGRPRLAQLLVWQLRRRRGTRPRADAARIGRAGLAHVRCAAAVCHQRHRLAQPHRDSLGGVQLPAVRAAGPGHRGLRRNSAGAGGAPRVGVHRADSRHRSRDRARRRAGHAWAAWHTGAAGAARRRRADPGRRGRDQAAPEDRQADDGDEGERRAAAADAGLRGVCACRSGCGAAGVPDSS